MSWENKVLVLVGGGHSHVAVIKNFARQAWPGARLILVSKECATPYSGMIPGYIAGHYSFEEAHIDLPKLCAFANVDFHHSSAVGLDLQMRHVVCSDGTLIPFHLVSINIGSTPQAKNVPGAAKHALPVKPITDFVRNWEDLFNTLHPGSKIVVVGGGAGGVELLLAIRFRLIRDLNFDDLEFHLVTKSSTVLSSHHAQVQRKFTRILQESNVRVHTQHRAVEVKSGKLICEPGQNVDYDVLIWATTASAPCWLRDSGLQTDDYGFAAVNDCLQSLSHPFVFASGDIAAVVNHPRPKSGVFAVRQGPPLAENLRRALLDRPLQPFIPQKQFLSLISTGGRYAVGSRGDWAFEGRWVWVLKDWIDRRWIRTYQLLT